MQQLGHGEGFDGAGRLAQEGRVRTVGPAEKKGLSLHSIMCYFCFALVINAKANEMYM